MILIELRLSKNLVGHRSKVVGESLYHLAVLMKLQALQVCQVDENIVVDLNSEVAALLDVDGQLWLLLCQLLNESRPVSERFSDLHADLSLGLPIAVELFDVQHKFLVLEEHRNLKILDWIP